MGDILPPVVTEPTSECKGTIFFLHGGESTGNLLRERIRFVLGEELRFKHLKIVYPTAPVQPFTKCGGELCNIWYDRLKLDYYSAEQWQSIDAMAEKLKNLIDEETKNDIPLNKIIIGGYSMGGGLSLHVGLRLIPDIGGLFSIASFLNDDSKLYECLKTQKLSTHPKFFMVHGTDDEDVPLEWSKFTRDRLNDLGVDATYQIIKGVGHPLTSQKLTCCKNWISNNFDF